MDFPNFLQPQGQSGRVFIPNQQEQSEPRLSCAWRYVAIFRVSPHFATLGKYTSIVGYPLVKTGPTFVEQAIRTNLIFRYRISWSNPRR